MRTVLTVIGTRPQYLKYAALAAAGPPPWREVLIDTGQHYDDALSRTFLNEYALPRPRHTLQAGSLTGLPRLGSLCEQLEPLCTETEPDALLCFGDTDSTLAAALAASRHGIPLIHVESGERSRDAEGVRIHPASAPEEATRVTVDHLAALLLCATEEAVTNLRQEDARGSAVHTGDIIYDLYLAGLKQLPPLDALLARAAGWEKSTSAADGSYALCTVHRAANTDDAERLRLLLDTLNGLDLPVLLPLHPRTRARIVQDDIIIPEGALHILPPLAHHEILTLLRSARVVLTDSGGLTREAYFSGVPSVILDDATAWYTLCREGWCTITGADPERIRAAVSRPAPSAAPRQLFGDGSAARKVLAEIEAFLQ